MTKLLFLVAWLADLVSVIPDLAVVPLAEDSRQVGILVRNTSPIELTDVKLQAESKYCVARTEPESLPVIHPSDRVRFRVTLFRTSRTGTRRFPVQIRLSSRAHPRLYAFELVADGSKQAGNQDGWIDVGVVKVHSGKPRTRTWIYALVGLVPVGLLLWLGWVFKKRARR